MAREQFSNIDSVSVEVQVGILLPHPTGFEARLSRRTTYIPPLSSPSEMEWRLLDGYFACRS